jgi:hypothetical protein
MTIETVLEFRIKINMLRWLRIYLKKRIWWTKNTPSCYKELDGDHENRVLEKKWKN